MKAFSTTWTVIALVALVGSAQAAPHHKSHKKHHSKAHAVAAAPETIVAPTPGMVGTWTLRDGDKPRTDIKMVFRPNGTFAFVGPNWNSAGKFKVEEHLLKLEWTAVDGTKVQPGIMHKDFSMGDGDASFTIDKYTYYKLGSAGPSAEKLGSKN